eukprot:6146104-Amphidinium_carterae.2
MPSCCWWHQTCPLCAAQWTPLSTSQLSKPRTISLPPSPESPQYCMLVDDVKWSRFSDLPLAAHARSAQKAKLQQQFRGVPYLWDAR